jgi:hypothetical protein
LSNNTPIVGAKPKCGIIMPISAIDGLSEAHWQEVNDILSDAISAAGFDPNLVSTAEEVGIIQKTIIHNLYHNPVVVCDVSGKNPNVMFELGMRLAFDRPTIIVKDDTTSYTFDTASIEHLGYPRDLRFNRIVEFKAKLAEKVKNTHDKAVSDHNYTTFLKHFGEFKVAKIDQTEVSAQEFMFEELKSLKESIIRLEHSTRRTRSPQVSEGSIEWDIPVPQLSQAQRVRLVRDLMPKYPEILISLGTHRLRVSFPNHWAEWRVAEFREAVNRLTGKDSEEQRDEGISSSSLLDETTPAYNSPK